VYDSSGAEVGSRSIFQSIMTNKYINRSVTAGQEYYIQVQPYNSSYSGTYRIGFTTDIIPPGVITLTADTWADGNLPTSSDVQWFKFTATASTQYIHVSLGTLTYLSVNVYNSSGTVVGSETNIYSSLTNKYISRTLTAGQVYYIRIRPYNSSYSGTYRIGFTTSTTAPAN